MAEYTKVVYGRVKEVYLITADSAEEAEDNWEEGELISSEWISTLDDEYPELEEEN